MSRSETEARRRGADPRRASKELKGGAGKHQQDWPGSESALRPVADHGEDSYRGAGRLEGRRALITGGDSGIGRAVALAFAREGADVAIAYFDEHADAEESARLVRAEGRTCVLLPGDVSEHEHCRTLVTRTVEAFGGLDILVNNAAYQLEQESLADITPEQLDRTFRTNIYAYIWPNCSQTAWHPISGMAHPDIQSPHPAMRCVLREAHQAGERLHGTAFFRPTMRIMRQGAADPAAGPAAGVQSSACQSGPPWRFAPWRFENRP